MLQDGNLMKEIFAVGEDFIAPFCKFGSSVVPFVDGTLECQRNNRLISFDNEVRQNGNEEFSSILARNIPNKLIPMIGVLFAMPIYIHRSSKTLNQRMDNGLVSHADAYKNLVTDVDAIGLRPTVDTNVTFAVEKSRSVLDVKHDDFQSVHWNDGEFGETPMPGSKECGRATPSQAECHDRHSGVCNEHVPSAKAKMCSELYGNVEKSAEMSGSFDVYSCSNNTSKVTDCNTKYIHWRPHSKRNMVPLDPDRFSVNQDAMVKLIGWAGNMTLSNSFLQGVLYNT